MHCRNIPTMASCQWGASLPVRTRGEPILCRAPNRQGNRDIRGGRVRTHSGAGQETLPNRLQSALAQGNACTIHGQLGKAPSQLQTAHTCSSGMHAISAVGCTGELDLLLKAPAHSLNFLRRGNQRCVCACSCPLSLWHPRHEPWQPASAVCHWVRVQLTFS